MTSHNVQLPGALNYSEAENTPGAPDVEHAEDRSVETVKSAKSDLLSNGPKMQTPKTLAPPPGLSLNREAESDRETEPEVIILGRDRPMAIDTDRNTLRASSQGDKNWVTDSSPLVRRSGMLQRQGSTLKRRLSTPATPNLYQRQDSTNGEVEPSTLNKLSADDRHLLSNMTGVGDHEDYLYTLTATVDRTNLQNLHYDRVDCIVRNLMHVTEEAVVVEGRRFSKGPAGADRGSVQSEKSVSNYPSVASVAHTLTLRHWLIVGAIGFVSVGLVIAMCVWSKEGLLAEHGLGHIVVTNTRAGHLHSRMFTTPATIALHGTATEYFEVRLVAMSSRPFDAAASHRLLSPSASIDISGRPASWRPRWGMHHARDEILRRLASSSGAVVGNLTYRLLADGTEFFKKTLNLREDEEFEHFETVDVGELGFSDAHDFTAQVTAIRSDGREVAFLLQVLRMPAAGRHRVLIGIILFVITFIAIVSENIHRTYCAFIGASSALGLVALIQETPHLHTITGMVDYGTLMLLFSMMILMRMLAVTGFFNWFAVLTLRLSKQDPKVLFFLLTNLCGVMSMVLDNVTCVLLTGPLTFSLAKNMHFNPRPLYLAMTICATVGGTATLIGDPPNIVIGLKMKIGFEKFLICNLPIVVFILPMSSAILYYRLKDMLLKKADGSYVEKSKLDIAKLQHENRIVDPFGFAKLAAILGAVLLALLLSPVHEIEPGWFTVMAMMACAILFEPHEFGKYLEFVEWDTLLFFALLFVLVEGLSELGVIRQLGDWIISFIQVFPESSQVAMSIVIILWVSSLGSAFLESLPYTTTMVYILLDLIGKKDELTGIKPELLIWPLSVGACVGGIGSIMGSSANLVCMAVAKRFGDKEEEKVQGGDFLRHGLPTLLILITVVTFYQLILFVACEFEP